MEHYERLIYKRKTQTPLCRAAVKNVINNGTFKKFGIKALKEELFKCGKKDVAEGVSVKLESLFDHNVFCDGELPLSKGKIKRFRSFKIRAERPNPYRQALT